jgi:hypothetical protein
MFRTFYVHLQKDCIVDSIWNVMPHGDARLGKWRGNWRMKWVPSTLHATSEHGVSSIRVQLQCDGTRCRTGGEVKGKLANAVGSQYPSHFLGTRFIQHYYRWCAHPCCQQSTELTPPRWFKWTRPFRRKTICGFCACAITFQLSSTLSLICYVFSCIYAGSLACWSLWSIYIPHKAAYTI